jgi:hypothetical protein
VDSPLLLVFMTCSHQLTAPIYAHCIKPNLSRCFRSPPDGRIHDTDAFWLDLEPHLAHSLVFFGSARRLPAWMVPPYQTEQHAVGTALRCGNESHGQTTTTPDLIWVDDITWDGWRLAGCADELS